MFSIESRIEKLEKFIPIDSPYAGLTIEELYEEMFLLCQRMSSRGIEPDLEILLRIPKCRQFYKEGTPWVMEQNHRLSVFLEFKQIMQQLEIPNKHRIESILNLGWRNIEINSDEVEWVVAELKDIDMGEEKPWMKGYLECSGK